jgi:hypothetical protein
MDGIVFTPSAKSAEAPDIEAGLYDARFDGVAKKYIEGGNFGDGERFEWTFTLLDDDGAMLREDREDNPHFGQPIQVTGLSSLSLNPKSKTVPRSLRYLKALMGEPAYNLFIENGQVAAEDLVGTVVQVMVDIRDSGWPTVKDVLPPRKARKTSRRTAEADAE